MAIIPGTNSGETLTGTNGDDTITALAGIDRLYGLAGSDNLDGGLDGDYLVGGPGDDIMLGGAGDDVYYVDSAGDQITELANEGTDAVSSSVSVILGDNVENLYLTGTGAIDGTGNALRNTIRDNAGINILAGGGGNDSYVVQNTGDQVIELANEGTDYVSSSASFTLGANIENLVLKGTANIDGTGNDRNNSLTGNTGINVLAGLAGNDHYYVQNTGDQVVEQPGEGTDFVHTSVDFTLPGNVEHMYLTGTGDINGTGNALRNTIRDNAGINILAGGAGINSYVVQNTDDQVIEQVDHGTTDYVSSSATFTLAANVEHLILTGNGDIDGTGNELNNQLTGNSGNNELNGGDGNDTLTGGAGNDQLEGGIRDDFLDGGTGADTIAGGNHNDTLEGAEGDDVLSGGGSNDRLFGGAGADTMDGGDSNDTLDGGTGADTMVGGNGNDFLDGGTDADTLAGGSGNDAYTVENAGDQVVELVNQGNDVVSSSVTFALPDNVEHLTLTGNGDLNGTGNGLNNTITGNSARNILAGGSGHDKLSGGAGNDELDGGEGDDRLIGGTNDDELHGGSGNDTLVGGTGADTMDGGNGIDTYTVDIAGDQVVEQANQGNDTIHSTVSFTLGNNVENLQLFGTDDLNGTGNELNNTISGNSGANVLNGGAGHDMMAGGNGNDTLDGGDDDDHLDGGAGADTMDGGDDDDFLYGDDGDDTMAGGNGNDWLNGGTGADTMDGGNGNDGYVVDIVGDQVVEQANQGNDTIHSTVSFTLPDNFENLELLVHNINGTGNELDNTITASSSTNVLAGGAGNDRYVMPMTFPNAAAQVVEQANQGIDTVYTSVSFTLPDNVENLVLGDDGYIVQGYGNDLANEITSGSALYDQINGGAGNDILRDTRDGDLIGGTGADVFLFVSTDTLVDQMIVDFSGITSFRGGAGEGDKIRFSGLGNGTYIGDGDFVNNGSFQIRANTNGGSIGLDANGDGEQDFSIKFRDDSFGDFNGSFTSHTQIVQEDFQFI